MTLEELLHSAALPPATVTALRERYAFNAKCMASK